MEKDKVVLTDKEEISGIKVLAQERKVFKTKIGLKPSSLRPGRSILKKQSIRPAVFATKEK